MAEFTHHVDVMLRRPEIGREIHARLATAAHRVITGAGAELAVAWPDWRGHSGEFGYLFRVFGTPTDLAAFTVAVAGMVNRNLIRASPPQPVPETVETVAYLRDRSVERNTPGFAARQQRRDQRAGRTLSRPPRQQRADSRGHSLSLQSASTGQNFALFIRHARRADREAGRCYGLGYTLPRF